MSHDCESAVASVIGMFVYGFQFLNFCSSRPYVASGVHWMYSCAESSPSDIAARAVSGLNVEPGGYTPAIARLIPG